MEETMQDDHIPALPVESEVPMEDETKDTSIKRQVREQEMIKGDVSTITKDMTTTKVEETNAYGSLKQETIETKTTIIENKQNIINNNNIETNTNATINTTPDPTIKTNTTTNTDVKNKEPIHTIKREETVKEGANETVTRTEFVKNEDGTTDLKSETISNGKRTREESNEEKASIENIAPPTKVKKFSFLDKLKSKIKDTKHILSTTTPTPTATGKTQFPSTTSTVKKRTTHHQNNGISNITKTSTTTTTTSEDNIPLSVAQSILSRVKKHKWAWPFSEPVDAKRLKIPDYYDIIKNPMDLSTVTKKLYKKKYNSYDEFIHDMGLIWSNCYLYNAPGSDVVVMCRKLQAYFDEECKKQESKYLSKRHAQRELSGLMDDDEFRPKKKKKRKKPSASRSRSRTKSAPSAAPVSTSASSTTTTTMTTTTTSVPKPKKLKKSTIAPMTFAQKKQLTEDIRTLDTPLLGEVIKIFQEDAAVNSRGDGATMEVDVAALSEVALQKLKTYVDSVKISNPKQDPYAYSYLMQDDDFSSDSSDTDGDEGFAFVGSVPRVIPQLDGVVSSFHHVHFVCAPSSSVRASSSVSLHSFSPPSPLVASSTIVNHSTPSSPDPIWSKIVSSSASAASRRETLSSRLSSWESLRAAAAAAAQSVPSPSPPPPSVEQQQHHGIMVDDDEIDDDDLEDDEDDFGFGSME